MIKNCGGLGVSNHRGTHFVMDDFTASCRGGGGGGTRPSIGQSEADREALAWMREQGAATGPTPTRRPAPRKLAAEGEGLICYCVLRGR